MKLISTFLTAFLVFTISTNAQTGKVSYVANNAIAATDLSSNSTRYFDSAKYSKFYENKWSKFKVDTTNDTHALSETEKIAGLSECWAQAKYNFANFDLVPSLNWDSVYAEYIPKVIAAHTTADYYKVLQNFYQHLRDGHTSITEPVYKLMHMNARLPFEMRWVENKIVVTSVKATKQLSDIKQGFEVVGIEHIPAVEYITKNISPYINFSTSQDSIERIYRYQISPGMAGTSLHLTFKDAKGKLYEKDVVREAVKSVWQPEKNTEFTVLDGNIAYLKVTNFGSDNVVKEFDSLYQYISPTKALIIDLRDNGGGSSNIGYEIIGCLIDTPFYPGKTVLRHYRPVGNSWGGVEKPEINGNDWKPYKKRLYKNPVVVLTSGATYSAAEDFTCAFKYLKRGKIFGTATGGSTGQPVMFNLPGGGFGRVCAKRDFFWDGLEFVGIGIQPDVEVKPTVRGVAAGKDEVLDAALQYLKS
jgi:hypothetical protein